MAKSLLLDTHALLWWLSGDERLPVTVRQAIEDPRRIVLASAVSAWEISIKSKIGKLEAPSDVLDATRETGLDWASIEPQEAYNAGQLPMHHRDPFDRLLVVQANARSARLVSRDGLFDLYEVDRFWG